MPTISTVSAHLWDGKKQLSGTLSLTPKQLIFAFDDFQKSHLNLKIPLMEIETAEAFLIFDLSRNGLKITGKNGQVDLFVLDDPAGLKKQIVEAMEQIDG